MADKKFRVTSPEGRTIEIVVPDGQPMPSDAEVDEMFASLPLKKQEPKPQAEQPKVAKPTDVPVVEKPKPPASAPQKPKPPVPPTPFYPAVDFTKQPRGPVLPGASTIMPSMITPRTAKPAPPAVTPKQPLPSLTTMTNRQKGELFGSMTPEERMSIEVNAYRQNWLSGSKPNSDTYKRFRQFVMAGLDPVKVKAALKGISPVGQRAFIEELADMRRRNEAGIAQAKTAAGEMLFGGRDEGMFRDPEEASARAMGAGLISATGVIVPRMRQAATATRLGVPMEEAPPLGFLPEFAMLPETGTYGAATSPSLYIQKELGNLAMPDTLLTLLGGAKALKTIGEITNSSRVGQAAFAAANIPGVVGAIQSGDPATIATAFAFSYAPDILGVTTGLPRTIRSARQRRAVENARRAFELQAPELRRRARIETAQEGPSYRSVDEDAPVIYNRPDDPDVTIGGIVRSRIDEVSGVAGNSQAARRAAEAEGELSDALAPTTPPAETETPDMIPPADTPSAGEGAVSPLGGPTARSSGEEVPPRAETSATETEAPSTLTPSDAEDVEEPKVVDHPLNGGQILTKDAQREIEDTMVAIAGGEAYARGGLTTEQRRVNYDYWKRQALAALANVDEIFNQRILPMLGRLDDDAVRIGLASDPNIRVVAAQKQTELLTMLLADPDNPQANEWRRMSNDLSRVIIESGSRAGLELAMTRWFTLSGFDWSATEGPAKIAAMAQRLGVDVDSDLISTINTVASNVREGTARVHARQNARAASAARRVNPDTSTEGRSRSVAGATRALRDVGPTEQQYQEALRRLRSGAGTTSAALPFGVNPIALYDLATVGAYLFKQGVVNFADWATAMTRRFGPKVEPHLEDIWSDVQRRSEVGFNVPKVNVMTLFSGGGLYELGFPKNTVNLVGAVESDPKVIPTYIKNHGDHVVGSKAGCMVQDVDFTQFRGKVDHLHASPVCKRYSKANKRKPKPTDLDMITARATARAIGEIRPISFSLENVTDYEGSSALQLILDALNANGYKWDITKSNAKEFGVPQTRNRIFLRAWQSQDELPAVRYTHGPRSPGQQQYTDWWETINDLIDPEKKFALNNTQIERIGRQIEGVLAESDIEGRLLVGRGSPYGGINTARPGKVAPTLTTKGGEWRVVIDGTAYRVPPRALARLMGVTEDYILPNTQTTAALILGNGIVPQMTAATVGPMLNRVAELKAAAEQGAVDFGDFGATTAARRIWQMNRTGPTEGDYRAARDRVKELLKRASTTLYSGGPVGEAVEALPDLVLIGWYLFKNAKGRAGRTFDSWYEAMQNDVGPLSRAQAEETWLSMRYHMASSRGSRLAVQADTFVDQIAREMKSRQKAMNFLEMIRDPDGTPTILDKMIQGIALTEDEQSRVESAWTDIMRPKTGAPKEKPEGAKRLRDVVDAVREERKRKTQEEKAAEQAAKEAERGGKSSSFEDVIRGLEAMLLELPESPRGLTGQQSPVIPANRVAYAKSVRDFISFIRKTANTYARQMSLDGVDQQSGSISLRDATGNAVSDFIDQRKTVDQIKKEYEAALRGILNDSPTKDQLLAAFSESFGPDRGEQLFRALSWEIRTKLADGVPLTADEEADVAMLYDIHMGPKPGPQQVTAPSTPIGMKAAAEKVRTAGRQLRAEINAQANDIARKAQDEGIKFGDALARRYGAKRAGLILDKLIAKSIAEGEDISNSIEYRLDTGGKLMSEDLEAIVDAIQSTEMPAKPKKASDPTTLDYVVNAAQQKASGRRLLDRMQQAIRPASVTEDVSAPMGGVWYRPEQAMTRRQQLEQFLPVAIQEYRDGAASLYRFRESIETRFPDMFTEDELNNMFVAAAKAYDSDMSVLDSEKNKIVQAIRAKKREQNTAWDNFVQNIKDTNNIYRALTLGADFGVLLTQGGLTALTRPGLLYAGLPKPGSPSRIQKLEKFVTGAVGNRDSASILRSMLQAWGQESKQAEFDGEAKALQQIRYGSDTYYEDSGLILESTNPMQTSLNRLEQYQGLESVELAPGIGPAYTRLAKPVYSRFERATAVGLNRLRISLFETLMEPFVYADADQRDMAARLTAELVNIMTGRNSQTPEARARMIGISQMLTAPEWYASRVSMAAGIPLVKIGLFDLLFNKQYAGMNRDTKLRVASMVGSQYARGFVNFMLLKTMFEAAGFEVETDPRSSEFGSVRIPTMKGGYRPLDITGGLGEYYSLATRFATATDIKYERGKRRVQPANRGDVLLNFLKSKATVVPQEMLTMLAPTRRETDKFADPTAASAVRDWFVSERTTPAGDKFTFTDPTRALYVNFLSSLPVGITLRSFFRDLARYLPADLTPAEKTRAMVEWLATSTVASVGMQLKGLRPGPEKSERREAQQIRESKFLTPEEKQRREIELMVRGKQPPRTPQGGMQR